jgi:hypothetical protein
MKPDLVLVPLCLVMLAAGNLAAAGHHCRGGHRVAVCPRCSTCCQLDVELGKEEKSCWQVECEQVSVPRVVFPWQTGKADCHRRAGRCDCRTSARGPCTCANNGAWVRTIKKLKKYTYECPACKYEWTPKTVAGDGASGRNGGAALEPQDGSGSPTPAAPDLEAPDQAMALSPLPEAAPESKPDVARRRFPFDLFMRSAGQLK